jgi:hypothetical protein
MSFAKKMQDRISELWGQDPHKILVKLQADITEELAREAAEEPQPVEEPAPVPEPIPPSNPDPQPPGPPTEKSRPQGSL